MPWNKCRLLILMNQRRKNQHQLIIKQTKQKLKRIKTKQLTHKNNKTTPTSGPQRFLRPKRHAKLRIQLRSKNHQKCPETNMTSFFMRLHNKPIKKRKLLMIIKKKIKKRKPMRRNNKMPKRCCNLNHTQKTL